MITIQPSELPILSKYIYEISGISLDKSKSYLLEARLAPICKEHDFKSFQDLVSKAKLDRTKKFEKQIIDAISTNETLFFRDSAPFELLKNKLIPEVIDAKTAKSTLPPQIKIWSAASSTGQELYSIAITIKEMLGANGKYRFNLLGTDISNQAIAQASYGKFNKFEIDRGLPQNTLRKYFTPDADGWKIKDEIRAMVRFQQFNLMSSFASLGKFDIIFCRNVAIYFTLEDRKILFDKIYNALDDNGFLVIGSTESLTGVSTKFVAKRHLRSIFYTKQ